MRKAISLFIAAILLISIIGCAKTPTWEEQYDLGIRYLSEGNYEEAIIAFTTAIEIDPSRTPAYIGRGDAYVGQASSLATTQGADDNYNSAAADYLAAIDIDPLASELYEKLSRVYIEQGDYDAAADVLELGYEATGDEKLSRLLDLLRIEINGLTTAALKNLEMLRAELEGPVTVVGHIIDNLDEYGDIWDAYRTRDSGDSEELMYSIHGFGIRFEPPQKVITENGIEYIEEAGTGMAGGPQDLDNMERLVGCTAKFTGRFHFTGEAEFSGPYPPGTCNNELTEYSYNPNGPWMFSIESYVIVE